MNKKNDETSKTLLMRNLSPEVCASIDKAKEWFDLKTNTAAVEEMLVRFWKLVENNDQLDKKNQRLVQNVKMLKNANDELGQAEMNHSCCMTDLFALLP